MRGSWFGLCVGLWAATSGFAVAQDQQAAPTPRRTLPLQNSVVVNPDWRVQPTAEDIGRYYPPLARMIDLTGRVKIKCEVEVSEELTGCSVVSEEPQGFGFGEATLSMAKLFRMRPKTVDGTPVRGASVVVPVAYSLPPSDQADAVATSSGAPPSADLLDLGRKLVQTMKFKAYALTSLDKSLTQARTTLGPTADMPAGQKIFSVLANSEETGAAAITEREAQIYARIFTPDQLKGLIAFYGTPTGEAWLEKQNAVREAESVALRQSYDEMKTAARAAVCAQVSCGAAAQVQQANAP